MQKAPLKSKGVIGGIGMMLSALGLVLKGIGDGDIGSALTTALPMFFAGLSLLGIRVAQG